MPRQAHERDDRNQERRQNKQRRARDDRLARFTNGIRLGLKLPNGRKRWLADYETRVGLRRTGAATM